MIAEAQLLRKCDEKIVQKVNKALRCFLFYSHIRIQSVLTTLQWMKRKFFFFLFALLRSSVNPHFFYCAESAPFSRLLEAGSAIWRCTRDGLLFTKFPFIVWLITGVRCAICNFAPGLQSFGRGLVAIFLSRHFARLSFPVVHDDDNSHMRLHRNWHCSIMLCRLLYFNKWRRTGSCIPHWFPLTNSWRGDLMRHIATALHPRLGEDRKDSTLALLRWIADAMQTSQLCIIDCTLMRMYCIMFVSGSADGITGIGNDAGAIGDAANITKPASPRPGRPLKRSNGLLLIPVRVVRIGVCRFYRIARYLVWYEW